MRGGNVTRLGNVCDQTTTSAVGGSGHETTTSGIPADTGFGSTSLVRTYVLSGVCYFQLQQYGTGHRISHSRLTLHPPSSPTTTTTTIMLSFYVYTHPHIQTQPFERTPPKLDRHCATPYRHSTILKLLHTPYIYMLLPSFPQVLHTHVYNTPNRGIDTAISWQQWLVKNLITSCSRPGGIDVG